MLYQSTRILIGRKPNQSKPIRNKVDDILAKADEQLARWEWNGTKSATTNPPTCFAAWRRASDKTDNISRAEIGSSIKSLNMGKATTTDRLYPLVQVVKCQLRPCKNS